VADTESADDGGPNSGLVDSISIRVPYHMSVVKPKKVEKPKCVY